MGRFRTSLVLALLASGPASAQIQSTYDYLLLPHAPQSDSARTYSYDANGNLVRSTIRSTAASKVLEYTPSNMIFKAGGSEYRYDTSGNRIAKIQRDANGNTTKIERYFGAIETDGTTRTKYYFFGSKRVAKKTSSGALSFYHSDHLNSTSVTTDASGNLQSRTEFYEFGAVKSQEGTDSPKYAYTGQEWDKETNLYNYNARMYDSAVGKFTSADSIIPDLTNPQSLNRYAYVHNNPLGYSDPSGHKPELLHVGWGSSATVYRELGTDSVMKLPAGEYSPLMLHELTHRSAALRHLAANGFDVAMESIVVENGFVQGSRARFVDGYTLGEVDVATAQGIELEGLGGLSEQRRLAIEAQRTALRAEKFASDLHHGNVMIEKGSLRSLIVDAEPPMNLTIELDRRIDAMISPEMKLREVFPRARLALVGDPNQIVEEVVRVMAGDYVGAATQHGTNVAIGAGATLAASRWAWVGTGLSILARAGVVAQMLMTTPNPPPSNDWWQAHPDALQQHIQEYGQTPWGCSAK